MPHRVNGVHPMQRPTTVTSMRYSTEFAMAVRRRRVRARVSDGLLLWFDAWNVPYGTVVCNLLQVTTIESFLQLKLDVIMNPNNQEVLHTWMHQTDLELMCAMWRGMDRFYQYHMYRYHIMPRSPCRSPSRTQMVADLPQNGVDSESDSSDNLDDILLHHGVDNESDSSDDLDDSELHHGG